MKYLVLLLTACSRPPRTATVTAATPVPFPAAVALRRDPSAVSVASVASYTWRSVPFHSLTFTMQLAPVTFGGDAYTNIYVNGGLWAQVGVNGYEHWGRDACSVPYTTDSRFFIGLAADNLAHLSNPVNTANWSNDISVALPSPLRYSDSATFTVASDTGRIRFYVDGQEITYRDVNYAAPEGTFDNTEAVRPTRLNDVRLELAVLADGGISGPCGSPESPFIPGQGPVSAAVIWSNVTIK